MSGKKQPMDGPDAGFYRRLNKKVLLEIGEDRLSNRLVRGRADDQSHLEALYVVAIEKKICASFWADLTSGPEKPGLIKRLKAETRSLDEHRWPDQPPADSAKEAAAPAWDTGIATVAALTVGRNAAGEEQVVLWHTPHVSAGSAALLLKWHLKRSDEKRPN